MSKELRCTCNTDGTVSAPTIAGQNERLRTARSDMNKSGRQVLTEFVADGESTSDRVVRVAARTAAANGCPPPTVESQNAKVAKRK